MKKSELHQIIKEEINISLVKKIADNYINLKKLYNNSIYPSTPHTLVAILKLEDKIKQMAQNEEFKQEFMKLMPKALEKILSK
jgi:uridine kinase